jgi:hypothetical protein
MATTARQRGKHPGGRPRTKTPAVYTPAQIKQIDQMARDQCKDTLIAEVLGVDIETFRDEFSVRCRRIRALGKRDILAWQRRRAKKGSDKMLVWMGQQHLEQSDKQAIEHSGQIETGREPTEDEWQRFLAKHQQGQTSKL